MFKRILYIVKDFCANTSLVGFNYISNEKIHFSERIFWLLCVFVSATGSYYLIREYQASFESNAISLVLEGSTLQDKTQFPAIAVCENGDTNIVYPVLTKYLEQLAHQSGVGKTHYIIEDYMLGIIFLNNYAHGRIKSCDSLPKCNGCEECPMSGYKELVKLVRQNCSELIVNCNWNGRSFNCCDFFFPLQTPVGECFFLNSIQATTMNGPHWLKTEIDWYDGIGELQIQFTKPVEVHIINTEDIPDAVFVLRPYKLKNGNEEKFLHLHVLKMINDINVRDTSPEYRRCRFPNENLKNASYNYYSFSTCIFECIKQYQLKICGCVSLNYVVKSNDKSPICDHEGYKCLEKYDLLILIPGFIRPWGYSNDFKCRCLPSCTDNEIKIIQESQSLMKNASSKLGLRIKQTIETHQYRRQAVRARLDVVVTIGGILGLFMGASILSGIEILYFFLARIFRK